MNWNELLLAWHAQDCKDDGATATRVFQLTGEPSYGTTRYEIVLAQNELRVSETTTASVKDAESRIYYMVTRALARWASGNFDPPISEG